MKDVVELHYGRIQYFWSLTYSKLQTKSQVVLASAALILIFLALF